MATHAANARWAKATPKQRKDVAKMLVASRIAKS